LSSECNWYRDQYDALDALVEALRTDSGWLEYRLRAVRDELLEEDAQAAEDVSAVSKVWAALLEWDKALRKAHEDAAAVWVAAAEFERSWLPPELSSSKTAPPSRGHGPGRARSRRRLRRPVKRPGFPRTEFRILAPRW
jgi:hypothetical protein